MTNRKTFDVTHRTHYRYSEPVVQSQHLMHVSPRPDSRRAVVRHAMTVSPAPALRFDGEDAFGNPITILDIDEPHKDLIVEARTTVENSNQPLAAFAATTSWDRLDAALYREPSACDLDVIQFRVASRLTAPTHAMRRYAEECFTPDRPVLDATQALTQRIFADFKFDATATDVSTPITEVFRKRRGVCQDFAHLTLAMLRALRVPARYVSGYILTLPPPGRPKLAGTDASHAWVSIWAPETGWYDFDPTNGLVAGTSHIAFAHGRDYGDVCPISGVILGGGDHSVAVGVDVIELSA